MASPSDSVGYGAGGGGAGATASGKPTPFTLGNKAHVARFAYSSRTASETVAFVVTGTRDEPSTGAGTGNKVNLWKLFRDDTASDSVEPAALELTAVNDCVHDGDVYDLTVVSIDGTEFVATASSTGAVSLFCIDSDATTGEATFVPRDVKGWKGIHSAAVSSLALNSAAQLLASVGEDARLNVLRVGDEPPVWWAEEPTSAAYHAVCFHSPTTVVAGGSCPSAQMKLWDTRLSASTPALVMEHPARGATVVSLSQNPLRPSVIAAGASDGSVTLWDVAMPGKLLNAVNAHASHAWSVQFHPSEPQYLFSGGEDGNLFLWDFNHSRTLGDVVFDAGPAHADADHLAIVPLWKHDMGVNCVDIDSTATMVRVRSCVHDVVL